MSNFLTNRLRVCNTYGLNIDLDAQFFIKANAVFAVVHLLLGAVAALLLALTKWSTIHLLNDEWFYRIITFHGLNMLIFWIIYFEMAVLYFVGSAMLNSKMYSKGLAWSSLILMVIGGIITDIIVLMGLGDVMVTSYAPLKAHPLFYLGIILFAVGALLTVINFFLTLYTAWKEKTYGQTMPLVAFGALAAAIIATWTILHGAATLVPTFIWSLDIGLINSIDPAWYRTTWWALGHASQQINVCVMVSIWYLIATLTVGAKPLNQKVCRAAFIFYLLFINVASAHHLLVDPAVSVSWKIWNTSYVMYLAVLASMIHGFTVPASVEVAMRGRGYTKGLFGWLTAAPWKDPAFSGFFLSLVIFGFFGGITGVTLGTQQINILAHNTLRIPGHFHTTVAGGTSLAFMALTYYVVPLIFQREYYMKTLCRIQPYIFALGIIMVSLGMSFAGSMGAPRRHWDINFSDANLAAGFDSSVHLWLGVLGVGGIIAFLGVLIFVVTTVAAVFFGRTNEGKAMEPWLEKKDDKEVKEILGGKIINWETISHAVPGTVSLTFVLLISFVVYYFANWKALTDLWHVR
jgi:cytochrome c oxidase subunit 1